jgi:hypothetical protein
MWSEPRSHPNPKPRFSWSSRDVNALKWHLFGSVSSYSSTGKNHSQNCNPKMTPLSLVLGDGMCCIFSNFCWLSTDRAVPMGQTDLGEYGTWIVKIAASTLK